MNLKFSFRSLHNSVTGKYSLGYFMLSAIAVLLLIISFLSNYFISTRYQNTTDELLQLNELYVDIEAINSSVNISYLYLRTSSYEDYIAECKNARDTIRRLQEYLKEDYAREIIDTLYTAETYMEQTQGLMDLLKTYIEHEKKDSREYQEIEAHYGETQETLAYVNLSFQSAYAHKLISVKQTQRQVQLYQQRLEAAQIALVVMSFLFCFLYCIKIIRGITRSFNKLTSVVKKIEADVYEEAHITMTSHDEFEEFAKALNHMIDVIQNQLRKIEENANIKEQLAEVEIENLRIYGELQKSQLTLLQSRINPHFLFNTLNMISSLARMENADRSAGLMEITAAYLRYNLDNLSKSVTLSQEIENLKNYIAIQELRFEDRYSYYFEIKEACGNFSMPFMILQPLVENSIKHGLAMRVEGGKIWIRAYREAYKLCLEVEDNGAGIGEKRICEIRESLNNRTSQSEHIGLRNIYMRLQYFYEEEIELQVSSGESRTQIRILLPFREEGFNAYDDYSG